MDEVWAVELYVFREGSRDYIALEGIYSSAEVAVAHLEANGAVREGPDDEEVDGTAWVRHDTDCDRVFLVHRYELERKPWRGMGYDID